MGMSVLARQFGYPRGLVGRLVARGNRDFNTWVVQSLRKRRDLDGVTRVVELGPGPGVGLACLLDAFPRAQVWGVDQSSAMLGQARRHNTSAVQGFAPLDLIVAVHVLYFWPDPVREITLLRAALAPTGTLALGYQLRPYMPRMAQQQFPRAGHRVYEADDEVRYVFTEAGFTDVEIVVKGPADAPHGRLALASR